LHRPTAHGRRIVSDLEYSNWTFQPIAGMRRVFAPQAEVQFAAREPTAERSLFLQHQLRAEVRIVNGPHPCRAGRSHSFGVFRPEPVTQRLQCPADQFLDILQLLPGQRFFPTSHGTDLSETCLLAKRTVRPVYRADSNP